MSCTFAQRRAALNEDGLPIPGAERWPDGDFLLRKMSGSSWSTGGEVEHVAVAVLLLISS